MVEQTKAELEQLNSERPLVTVFRHNRWANLRLLDACAALDEGQLAATTAGTFGDIYDTLKHMVSSERGYLHRLRGGQQPAAPLEGRPALAELRRISQQTGEGLVAVAQEATGDDRSAVTWDDGTPMEIPSSVILTQVINHATEHRSQVMTIMTQQGLEPPDVSGWSYLEDVLLPSSGS